MNQRHTRLAASAPARSARLRAVLGCAASLFFAPLLGAALTSGCIGTFDPALYMRDAGTDAPEEEIDAATEDMPDAAEPEDDAFFALDAPEPIDAPLMDGGPPIFTLGDYCAGDVAPEIVIPAGSTATSMAIDTRGLADHGSGELICARETLAGPDGFALVRLGANDRWHFHFRHVGPGDPALYVLPTCDVRQCADVVADVCDTAADEHLTVTTGATAGSYLLGIDTADPAGLTGSLEVIRPRCGNGTLEHSETCDDADLDPGDGCDENCRRELTAALPEEQNPNDDRFSANHVLGAGPITVVGRIATPCEVDWYVIDVPAASDVRAELLTSTGTACTSTRPENIELDLFRETGSLAIATGIEPGGGPCAEIDPAVQPGARSLPAGRYFVRVYALNDVVDRPFSYGLRLTITTS